MVASSIPASTCALRPHIGRAEDIRYALAWQPPPGLLKTLPNLRLIVSVGAGVDHLLSDPDLPDVPMVRFVDPDLTGRMVEYVALHVLYHHRRMASSASCRRARCGNTCRSPPRTRCASA